MADEEDRALQDSLSLRGVVLCCTSLPQDARSRLPGIAEQMGAVHKLDLTSDVTHLIVGNVNTAKYKYVAKERQDMRVLKPEWIEAVRDSWTEGGQVDVAALEDEYRLGAFFGLKICVTGFDNLEQREQISDRIVEEGAEYHGDLTKAVTHLIAAVPQGAKYTHAKNWKTPIVSFKWFEDSVRRGMALDESLYDPTLPSTEQGRGAMAVKEARTSLGKRSREDESQTTDNASKPKLRRTASSRLHSQSQDMWNDISSRGGTNAPSESDQWKDSEASINQRPTVESVHVRRSDVFPTESVSAPDGMFAGRYILIRGFPRDRSQRLQEFLKPNGASIVHSVNELERASRLPFFKSRLLLMPHASEGSAMVIPDVPPGTEIVSEWWLERCIQGKVFHEPSAHILFRPLTEAKVAGFADLRICITGFPVVDFRQTALAIKLMGATYEEDLSPSISVLVSGADVVKKEKAWYAAKHNIKIVTRDWLWACLASKQMAKFEPFIVDALRADAKDDASDAASSSRSNRMPRQEMERVRKDDAGSKRLSGTRRKHATSSLAFKATSPVADRSATKQGPFILEDDEQDDEPAEVIAHNMSPSALESARPEPLQALSTNASPRKAGSQSKLVEPTVSGDDENAPEASMTLDEIQTDEKIDEPQQPILKPHEDLRADLAALIHRPPSARPTSAVSDVPQKRKSRKLGRSTSSMANRTFSGSAQSASSLLREETNPSGEHPPTSLATEVQLPPGTQLGYETADAEAHRVMMERKMKVSLQDSSSGKRVASVGMIKDSFAGGEAAVGSRVRVRTRAK
ncbi:protein kinase activating protein dpb11 [Recurvomyces mirabilis]|uniref:Protein kinase activating protein dpb11 n=1 Tax=Recurvomyces mirabilis TaxID=574656 RepID=A0AAE0WXN4_9PEZI|nr:protein kinase activating protein dpb11 [Recurvomyces mirabilis]KAK5162309.1 protein kinase activating protein dpb11 [Recurvomyces mirabilis]